MGSYDFVSNENKTNWCSRCGEHTLAGASPMMEQVEDEDAAGVEEGVQAGCPAAGTRGACLGDGSDAAGPTCAPTAL